MIHLCCADIRGLDSDTARHPGRTRSKGSAFAWSLLEHVIVSEYGMKMPVVALDDSGKPFFPEYLKIHFSLGHTSTHVICAVAESPVGCDIERHRELRPDFEHRITLPEERRDFFFFDLWVLRESYYKLMGKGDLRKIRFSVKDGEICAPVPGVVSRVYSEVEGCSAALCCFDRPSPEMIAIVPPVLLQKIRT